MEHDDQPVVGREGIPRRRMLKRIGAGAAIAWTAPILTSIKAPAFAQPYGACPPESCAGDPCGDQTSCPTNPDACTCSQETESGGRTCVCIVIFTCPGPPCASSADCDAGFVCTNTCCGDGQCAPICTGNARRPSGANLSYRG